MKRTLATGLAMIGLGSAGVPAAAQQQDAAITIFTVSTYGLAVDETCQVFDNMRYETAKHLQMVMRAVLVGRAGESAVAAEEDRLSALASEHWTGCLPREGNESEWQNVDVARFYADALIAAPGAMADNVASCSVQNGSRPIDRSTMTQAKAIADARYSGKPTEADYNNMVTAFADQMTKQCLGQDFSADLVGPAAIAARESLRDEDGPTSLDTYGEWTAYKFFEFKALGEFGVSAYRTPDPTSGPLAQITLKETGTYNTVGTIYAMADGSLHAYMLAQPTGLIVLDSDGDRYTFNPQGAVADGPYKGLYHFMIDAETAAPLFAKPGDTVMSFHATTPSGEPAHQYPSHNGYAGSLPLSRLNAALAWATAPVAPDL